MRPERKIRYQEKINYIVDNVKDFPLKPSTELEKKGIYYCIQTVIESLIDLIAMAVKDIGIPVKDDVSNIDVLIEKRSIPIELGEKLKKANGLRNLLVHRYNGIDEKIIIESLTEIKTMAYHWIEIIELILDETTKN